ncbi:hypothetical protein D3C73_1429030 [compost metagenome]
MTAGQVIEKPAGTGQQQATDNKGFAGTHSVDHESRQQAPDAQHNGGHAVGL